MSRAPTKDFKKWALGFGGADGGDLGFSHRPSRWVCGIEWGGGHTVADLREALRSDVTHPPKGYCNTEYNLKFHYNRQKMKLFSAINGGIVHDFRSFATNEKPFTSGATGYFKTNLYPISFRNTSASLWKNEFGVLTGFDTKRDYAQWCEENRFNMLRQLSQKHRPELIVCAGKTYVDKFKKAFCEPEDNFTAEEIEQRTLYWLRNKDGTLVIVIPFMSGRWGLVRNIAIQAFGERIGELLAN
ncbi:hypothetical protein CWI80_02090 [Pseudidiomarina sediminum]|uniref:Uracil-DNA glycosylase-like domain-containing protein n=1 Tax=Pseudidiomarina sediminum TaxID=431675 RepID=A0A432Z8F7_9GAMM|nr:hypothetical protein [Pseudidiomarina sediminum]MBY6063319.1 hypothetical protein [Pseudidiomarina sediminum]RUO74167.1 hypothetical protein CWI80_02090 [Pseudidiomarina sediminum]